MCRDISVVGAGCCVQVRHSNGLLACYRLLGGQYGAGWVPPYSALGVALLGKRVGDTVRPRGWRHVLEIVSISPIVDTTRRSSS